MNWSLEMNVNILELLIVADCFVLLNISFSLTFYIASQSSATKKVSKEQKGKTSIDKNVNSINNDE